MSAAVERLQWRFDAYEKLASACRGMHLPLRRFLGLRPERLRLRFGESVRHSRVPVVFAEDLVDQLSSVLPAPALPPTSGDPALPREELRRFLSLAQVDGDLDPLDVVAWEGADRFVAVTASQYERFLEEARSSPGGEETAAFFQSVANSVLRNVLFNRVGAGDRFLGLAALLAHLGDRALSRVVQGHGDGLSVRLGLLLMAGASPLAIMASAPHVAARPGNTYRTVPAAYLRAAELVRSAADSPDGMDLFAVRPRLAAELLADNAVRVDLGRSMLAEAIRDLALLATLTQGTELRELAGSSAALGNALFTPLGPSRLVERLRRHPRAGEGAIGRLLGLSDSFGPVSAGDLTPLERLGSLEARADLAAGGALVLALDELALEQASHAVGLIRPVPPAEAEQARQDGRAYWFGLDDQPLYLVNRRREEAFLFADMKDFTQRTAAVHEHAMGEFLKRVFYDPILRACAHVGRAAGTRVEVVNLLGDAVALRGDIASMIALGLQFRELLAGASRELAEAARKLLSEHDVLSELEVEITATEQRLAHAASRPGEPTEDLNAHLEELKKSRARWQATLIGGGLEAGVFITFGHAAVVIETGTPEVGEWRVVIGEHLNAAARGTSRSAETQRHRAAALAADERAQDRTLVDPFKVHTAADPCELGPTSGFTNAGAAMTGEALAAWRRAAQRTLTFSDITLQRDKLPARLARYWFPRPVEELVLGRDAQQRPALLLRRTGRTIFRGLEARGGSDVWEIVLVDEGFGRDLVTALDAGEM